MMMVHYPYACDRVYHPAPFLLPRIPQGPLSHQIYHLLGRLKEARECQPEFVVLSNRLIQELLPRMRFPHIRTLAHNVYDHLQGCSTDPRTYTVFLCALKAMVRQPGSSRCDLIKKTEKVLITAESQGCLDTIVLKNALHIFRRLSYLPGVLKIMKRDKTLPQEVHDLFRSILPHFPPTALRATAEHQISHCPVTSEHVRELSGIELPHLLDDPALTSTVLDILMRLLANQQNRPRALSLAKQLCQYYSEYCRDPLLYRLYLEILAQHPPQSALVHEAHQAFENACLLGCLEPKLLFTYLQTLQTLHGTHERLHALEWMQKRYDSQVIAMLHNLET
jgi:hypothetical protein